MKNWRWMIATTIVMLTVFVTGKTIWAEEQLSTQQSEEQSSMQQESESMSAEFEEMEEAETTVECVVENETNPFYYFLEEHQTAELYDGTQRAKVPEISGPRLDNFESGISYLRNAFVSRQTHIECGFYCDQPIENAGDAIKTALFAHTKNPIEGDYLRFQYQRYSVTRYLISSGSRYCYLIFMDVTYMTDAAEEQVVNTQVSNLLESLGVSTMSSYEKIKTIYDWICQNVRYDSIHAGDTSYLRQFSAYGALMDHTAVCQGYAVLLYRLLLECGVDVRVIPGNGNGTLHAWNIAEIDGVYYNLDATWDAGKATYEYFLCSEADFTGHVRLAEYQTDSFLAAYPMSQKTYGKEDIPEETTPEEPTPEEPTPEEPTTEEPTQPQLEGLCFENGIWKYYENGKVCETYTGLTLYYGTWYYVENGILNWKYTGLTNYYGTWYYVENGRLNWNYTGLTNYYGTWYYVQKGVLNWKYTGLTNYYGTWYYIDGGRLNWNYTGLTNYYGTWYYVQKGILNWNYTGLTNYYGTWYYVQKGILNWNYSGTTYHAGIRYLVTNGVAKRQ